MIIIAKQVYIVTCTGEATTYKLGQLHMHEFMYVWLDYLEIKKWV